MAGFDFTVPKHDTGEALQRALLRWAQRVARDLDVELRYRSEGGDFRVELGGSLPLMQALRAYLENDFPPFTAAFRTPAEPGQRRRIAEPRG